MDSIITDATLTYGLASMLVLVSLAGVVALPWRTSEVRASSQAWNDLSVLSGGVAREGLRGLRGVLTRLAEAGVRRPTGALTRTLS